MATGTPRTMISQGARASDRATSLVLNYYDRFNRRDWGGMLELLAEDVHHDVNQGWRETGRHRFAEFLARMARCYEEHIGELCVMTIADGNRAAVEYVVEGKYIESDPGLPPARGQTYRLRGGAFFDIAAGRITRVTNYYNLEDWLRQIAD